MESISSFHKLHSGRNFIGREEVYNITLDKRSRFQYTINMDLTCTLSTDDWKVISACMRLVQEIGNPISPQIDLIARSMKEQFTPQVRAKKTISIRRIKNVV